MDVLPQLLTDLLDCASDRLTVAPCRSFVNPGPNAPWDSCEVSADGGSGQLWIAHLMTTPDWPAPTGLPKPCVQLTWTAFIELGITRCQMGGATDDGAAPDPDLITSDAALQQVDRFELQQAIVCCPALEERDVVFDRWEAYTPSGNCVASRWLFRVRIGSCPC